MMARRLSILVATLICGVAVAMAACGSSDSLFPVYVDGEAGYVDRSGEIVIEPQFAWAGEFSEGLAPVTRDNETYGYNDGTGAYAIQPQFQYAGLFSQGLAAVSTDNEKYGYVDTSGKVVVQPRFAWAGEFSEGLAAVAVDAVDNWGYVDKTGEIVIQPQFYWVGAFSEGLAPVRTEMAGGWGYINTTGSFVIQPEFASAGEFSEGLAAVGVNDQVGFVDKTGAWVIQPQFAFPWAGPFSDGLAPASLDYEGYGYIEKTGAFVIQPQYQGAQSFSDGLAYVLLDEFTMAYIDKTGKVVWEGESGEYYHLDEDGGEDTIAPPVTGMPITEQEIMEIAAPALGVSTAEVDVWVYESFGEWSAAAVFPVGGEAGLQAVFQWTGDAWSLFWLQNYSITSDGIVEFEDPNDLGTQGVPQAVIDWLNLDM